VRKQTHVTKQKCAVQE